MVYAYRHIYIYRIGFRITMYVVPSSSKQAIHTHTHTHTHIYIQYWLAFTRYCHYQYGSVHGIQMVGRGGFVYCAIGQCRWEWAIKEWLIRAQKLWSKTISCKGQSIGASVKYVLSAAQLEVPPTRSLSSSKHAYKQENLFSIPTPYNTLDLALY